MPYLRLRQICLVSADLAGEAARIKAELGADECYRDPNVAKYGPGTAAGRFLERHGGRYGYMVILDCDDPERRQAHVESLGIRIANVIRHGNYLGIQLHPKDTGAAMIEFNRTEGGADPMGPYSPAGPDWQRASRGGALRAVELECPDPDALASRWGQILERPVQSRTIALDAGAIRFLPGNGPDPVFAGVVLQAATPQAVEICGVRFRSVDE
jgi:hypothetical protein